jgi:hypothetical protein
MRVEDRKRTYRSPASPTQVSVYIRHVARQTSVVAMRPIRLDSNIRFFFQNNVV